MLKTFREIESFKLELIIADWCHLKGVARYLHVFLVELQLQLKIISLSVILSGFIDYSEGNNHKIVKNVNQ